MAPAARAPVLPSRPRTERSASAIAAALGRRLAEQQRRAGRRIDLHAVVHLEDLDVPVLAERRRGLAAPGRRAG